MLFLRCNMTHVSYNLQPILHSQFGEDVADMAFDSIDSNHELLCNLLVGCTPCECLEDLQLSLSQRIKQGLSLGVLSRLLRLMFLHLTLLEKGSEHCVQVGSWPSFALLF